MPKAAERESSSLSSKEDVRRSVRVFAVAPISTELFCQRLESGVSIDQFSLVEVILAQKADTKLVTGIGGQVHDGEDLLHAAMRKVFEKTLLTRESRHNLDRSVGQEEGILYHVRGWTDTYRTFTNWLAGREYGREAYLTVMPVRSRNISLHEPREDDDGASVYKVKKLVNVTPKELETLLFQGSVETAEGESYTMFGHLTHTPTRDVVMTPESRKIQEKEFDRVIDEIYAYEDRLREEMLEEINRVRRWHDKPMIDDLSQGDERELERGFLAAQWRMGMTDERMRDREIGSWNKHSRVQGIEVGEGRPKEKPARPSDLFTSALYLREFPPGDVADALVSTPTLEVIHAANVLKHALRAAVLELYDIKGADIRQFSSNGTRESRTIDLVAALKAIWPNIVVLPPHEHIAIIRRMDQLVAREIAMRTGKSPDVIRRAMETPQRLPHYIAREMHEIKHTFQEHHPTNEAASAIERPFVQLLHILGLHPYITIPEDSGEALNKARGEILMQEAVVFAAIPVAENYLDADMDDSYFEYGLAKFFKQPAMPDKLFLSGIPHSVYSRRTKNPVGERKLNLWHDKRPMKLDERIVLKSLIEQVVDDRFCHNFVIKDENFSDAERRDVQKRLDFTGKLGEAMMSHYRRTYRESDGWEVGIVPGTHKTYSLDTVRHLMSIQSQEERAKFIARTKGGIRPGSFGNLIIREKFVFYFKRDGKEMRTEVNIYPLETIDLDGTVLQGSELIGFIEKLEDDASGRHAGDRLIQVDEKDDPTAPSLLEMYQPAAWYPSLFDTIKYHQHKPKKKGWFS